MATPAISLPHRQVLVEGEKLISLLQPQRGVVETYPLRIPAGAQPVEDLREVAGANVEID